MFDTADMWWDDQLQNGPAAPGGNLCVLPAASAPVVSPQVSDVPHPRQGSTVQAPVDPWQWWWDHARRSAHAFLAGHVPPEIAIFGPVLVDGESGLLEADVALSLLYGGDGQYARSDYLVLARPAVMVGALAVNAAINHRRKRAAQRDAEPSWREQRTAHIWSTTHRVMWDGPSGLESLWYGDISGFYPDLDSWTLVVATSDGNPPVRLVGPAVPLVALWTATAVMGQRWSQDPRLAALLR
ncbi:hypothetical protein [Mycobacterium sp. AT1]|uniref:hypothetical protein n=1 Tax=Mycobacterium sp. AT1 TaxID=1961706 RepID=UPI00114DC1C7|nr:hypothetical protein [Mycobacterium sp. AT1]